RGPAMDSQARLLVHSTCSVENFPEMLHMRWKSRRLFFAAKHFVRNGDCVGARDADEGDRTFTRRSGNCGDRVARDDQLLLCVQTCRSFGRICFSVVMHFRFCSMVPTEMRTHSGSL